MGSWPIVADMKRSPEPIFPLVIPTVAVIGEPLKPVVKKHLLLTKPPGEGGWTPANASTEVDPRGLQREPQISPSLFIYLLLLSQSSIPTKPGEIWEKGS